MFSPSSWISPSVRTPRMSSLSRLMERRKVDFPHPDGPMSAVIERDGSVRLMLLSACFSPYQKEKLVAVILPGWGDEEGGLRSEESFLIPSFLTPRCSFVDGASSLIQISR